MKLAIKTKQNALNDLSTECIQLANCMITEIDNYLKGSLANIKKEKRQIYNFILKKENEQADNIFLWAKSLQLLKRKRTDYLCCMKNFLCVDRNSSYDFIDIENLRKKIEKLERDYEEAKTIIQEKDRSIREYKEECENKQNEVKELEKKYNEISEKLNNVEKEFDKFKKICQENQNIINTYEAEKNLNINSHNACQKSLDQANTRIKSLDSDIANQKNNEETKKIPEQSQNKSPVILKVPNIIQEQKPKFVYPSVGNF